MSVKDGTADRIQKKGAGHKLSQNKLRGSEKRESGANIGQEETEAENKSTCIVAL